MSCIPGRFGARRDEALNRSVRPLLDRPVFIVGAPRSGTSVLGRVLGEHPDLSYLNEPRLIWERLSPRSDYLPPGPNQAEAIEDAARRLARSVGGQSGLRLLEKSPGNSLRIPILNRMAPDCLIIHIYRDPLSAVSSAAARWEHRSDAVSGPSIRRQIASIRDADDLFVLARLGMRRIGRKAMKVPGTWGPQYPGLAEAARGLGVVDAAALQWTACVGQAVVRGRELGPDRYVEIELERFDSTTVRSLLEWLDLPPADEVFTHLRHTWGMDDSRIRRRDLNDLEREAIIAWTAPGVALFTSDDSFRLTD